MKNKLTAPQLSRKITNQHCWLYFRSRQRLFRISFSPEFKTSSYNTLGLLIHFPQTKQKPEKNIMLATTFESRAGGQIEDTNEDDSNVEIISITPPTLEQCSRIALQPLQQLRLFSSVQLHRRHGDCPAPLFRTSGLSSGSSPRAAAQQERRHTLRNHNVRWEP